jgi:hypothetical protein
MKTKDALEAYAKKTLKHVEDLDALFADEMAEPELEETFDLPEDHTPIQYKLWKLDLREYTAFRDNHAVFHAIIYGQCSEAMKAKLKSHADFLEMLLVSTTDPINHTTI